MNIDKRSLLGGFVALSIIVTSLFAKDLGVCVAAKEACMRQAKEDAKGDLVAIGAANLICDSDFRACLTAPNEPLPGGGAGGSGGSAAYPELGNQNNIDPGLYIVRNTGN